MSFPITLDVPTLSKRDIERANEFLGPSAKALRRLHWRWMERVFMRELKGAEFTLLAAIVSRTLSWGKMLEIITLEQFRNGILDDAGQPKLSGDGMPIFAGTGMDRKTIIKALDGLVDWGLVTRYMYQGKGWNACAYMPVTVWYLTNYLEHVGRPFEDELPAAVLAARRYNPETEEWVFTPLEERFLAHSIDDPIVDEPWREAA